MIPQEKPVEEAGKPEFHQEPDQYTPREPEAASGRYWMEQGEEGSKVRFDAPEDKDAAPGAKQSEERPVEQTTTDTDEVDREIERLKKKLEDLRKRLDQPQGPEEDRLEKQIKQVESELQRKDNDTYRKAHAKIS